MRCPLRTRVQTVFQRIEFNHPAFNRGGALRHGRIERYGDRVERTDFCVKRPPVPAIFLTMDYP